jgi:hyperosmotically inducible protein
MKPAGTTVYRAIGLGVALGIIQTITATGGWATDLSSASHIVLTASTPDADNTKHNARDRDGDSLTPMDQSGDKHDIDVTTRIRKALVDDDSLSTTAKNIKIVTIDGKVTLRGPVQTAEERAKIVKKATAIAGVRVDDQLDIKSR